MSVFLVIVTGVPEVGAALVREGARITAQGAAGLEAAGRVVRDVARANLDRHRYSGRAARETTVSAPLVTRRGVEVSVGIHRGSAAPEGGTLQYGWRSSSGRRPPSEPLIKWALAKGIARNEREARAIAFTTAKKMAARGYSFGTIRWLDEAAAAEAPRMAADLARFIHL